MKIALLLTALVGALLGWHALARQTMASLPAATFTVNSLNDAVDLLPGDGVCDSSAQPNSQCTLRAAVQETNALSGADTIILPAGAVAISVPVVVQAVDEALLADFQRVLAEAAVRGIANAVIEGADPCAGHVVLLGVAVRTGRQPLVRG